MADLESTGTSPPLAAGQYVVLEIGGNGIGMTDKVKAHVYELFSRLKVWIKGSFLSGPSKQSIPQPARSISRQLLQSIRPSNGLILRFSGLSSSSGISFPSIMSSRRFRISLMASSRSRRVSNRANSWMIFKCSLRTTSSCH